MNRKIIKISVFVLVFCTSVAGFAQMKGVVEDSVSAKHQAFKESFESLDKKFKSKLKEKRVATTAFKKVANESQFLIEKKKITKLLDLKSGKRYGLADTYNKLVEMNKKNRVEIDVNYIITGTPSLVKAKNKRFCTYKTTAALRFEATANNLTSITKNELTMVWTVELNDAKGKIKSTQLTSIKAKMVSGFFEYEKQKMQEIANDLIEKYYQNLQSKKWEEVFKPEISNKEEVKNQLQNSGKIDLEGTIRVPMPNSQTVFVGEESVPSVNLYVSEDNAENKQVFALTFYIKIHDNLENGEITKVAYRQSNNTVEKPQVVVSEPVKETPPPLVKEVGMSYKVQILALYEPLKQSELPKEFRDIENVVMEESVIDGKTYYQYVIPVGNNMKDAQTLKNNLIKQGIKNAWIVKYKDGKRVLTGKGK